MEVFVDDETKLTLHGLQQYYCKLKDSEKNRKLFDLLDVLEFNQVWLKLAVFMLSHLSPTESITCKALCILNFSVSTLCSDTFGFVLGGNLCENSAALYCSVPAAGGAEFPCHCNS